jgi:hypothetical protein
MMFDLMESDVETLKSWITEYMKHKDIFQKSIKEIKQGERDIQIEYKGKRQIVLIEPCLENMDAVCDTINKNSVVLAAFNTRQNLNKVIDYWNKLSIATKLHIYFVNPQSQTEKRWIISPYTHNMVSNRSSLKSGLMSLFSTVDPVKDKAGKNHQPA